MRETTPRSGDQGAVPHPLHLLPAPGRYCAPVKAHDCLVGLSGGCEQLRRKPLLREHAVDVEVVGDEGEPLAVAVLPREQDAWMRPWGLAGAADPDVPPARGHRWDGVLVSPS